MLKTISHNLCKRTISNQKYLSSAAQPLAEERLQSFRTTEENPVNHGYEHIGQFYRVNPNKKSQLFAHGGLTKTFETQAKTFNETCLMVREPAVDVINCLKAIDYSKPATRFVLYGVKGSGKSLILAHIVHYAHKDKFLIVHVPWVGNWMRRSKEYSNSESKEGFVDLNIDAAAWLGHFKAQNSHLLKNAEFKTSKEYTWSKRETTPLGSPISELIEHGINRVKYASDCIVVLAEEIKNLSNKGVCKTLVAIDGFNAFFYPNTRVITEKKEKVHPHKITLTEGFLNLSKFDWNNSAVIVTVDEIAIAKEDQISHLPRYLLGKDGFEHMDPFVPIYVSNYTKKEFKSCMDYYRERKWVKPVPGQDDELAFISGSNPYNLMKMCGPL